MKSHTLRQGIVWSLLVLLGGALAACQISASAPPTATKAGPVGPASNPTTIAPTMPATDPLTATTPLPLTAAPNEKPTTTLPNQGETPLPPTAEPPVATQPPPIAPVVTAAPPTVVAPVVNCANPYIVQQGDWIYKIARECRIDPKAIEAANPGINPNFIIPGQKLNLPAPGAEPQPAACAGTYTVVRGDTLFSIAYRCGLTTEQMAAANGIRYPFVLHPGEVLKFP